MSKWIKRTGWRELSDVVQTEDGRFWLADSNNTVDFGYETMVFEWDKEKGTVSNWTEVFCARHPTEVDMRSFHLDAILNLEILLREEDLTSEL